MYNLKRTILFVFMLPLEAFAQWWNPLAPKDYEDCAEVAAKSAKTTAALGLLIQRCAEDFPARRDGQGGYIYFDSTTNKYFKVSDPKITKNEWKKIEEERFSIISKQWKEKEIADQRAAEAALAAATLLKAKQDRSINAASKIKISRWALICPNPGVTNWCPSRYAQINIANNSKEYINGVTFNLSILPAQTQDCSGIVGEDYFVKTNLPPNGKATLTFNTKKIGVNILDTLDAVGCISITNTSIK